MFMFYIALVDQPYILDYKIFQPDAALNDLVKYCVFIQFQNTGQSLWIPADRRNQLLLLFEGGAQITYPDQTKVTQAKAALRGTFDQYVEVCFTGGIIKTFAVDFTEIGLSALFGCTGKEVKNQFYPIHFTDTLSTKDSAEELNSKVQRHMINLRGSKAIPRRGEQVLTAIKQATLQEGNIQVRDLAKRLDVNERTLRRSFLHYTGITPKQYLSQLQFQEVVKSILVQDEAGGAQMASAKGYYDQAHLIKVFQRFAGITPSEIGKIDPSWVKFIFANE